MERGYNERKVRKQILTAREHSKKELIEREKTKISEQKLTFSLIYCPVFHNIRNILPEFELLLAHDKEHKKVFPDVLVVGFHNGKNLKGYLVRAELLKIKGTGKCEPYGKKLCLVCWSIRACTTFTTEACWETFKIQDGLLD